MRRVVGVLMISAILLSGCKGDVPNNGAGKDNGENISGSAVTISTVSTGAVSSDSENNNVEYIEKEINIKVKDFTKKKIDKKETSPKFEMTTYSLKGCWDDTLKELSKDDSIILDIKGKACGEYILDKDNEGLVVSPEEPVALAYGESIEDICNRNKKYFVKYFDYHESREEAYKAALFKNKDNYYAIYSKGIVRSDNKHLTIEMKKLRFNDNYNPTDYYTIEENEDSKMYDYFAVFPCVCKVDCFGAADMYSKGINWEDYYVFDSYNYSDFKEFYEGISDVEVEFDDDKKTALITGEEITYAENMLVGKAYILVDFANRTISSLDENKNVKNASSKTYKEGFVELGTNSKNEKFILEKNVGTILIEKKGKRKVWISGEYMGTELSKISDGWNCVGEYMEGEIKEKSKDEYEIKLKLHLYEEGPWEEDMVLKVNGDGEIKKVERTKKNVDNREQ